MSLNALETALWRAYTNHDDLARYKADAAAYAALFELDAGERAMLIAADPCALIAYGANSLLVMMVWQALNGLERLADYFAMVNGPAMERAYAARAAA